MNIQLIKKIGSGVMGEVYLHPWKFKMGQKSQNKLTKFDRFKPCKF